MAEKRMFAKTIIDSDAFLDMPQSTQNLYFHLAMRADDDGFVNNPKKIIRVVNSSNDDLKLLITKRFLIAFESGIVVIKHWKIHNYIAKDRYRKTKYIEELSQLDVNDNGSYTDYIQPVYELSTQSSLGKVSIDKVREDELSNNTEIDSIIDYYNKVTSQKRRYTKASREHISARLEEGFTIDDCKKVIDIKYNEWKDDKEMSKYITIETFFRPTKFEKYLNQEEKKPVQDNTFRANVEPDPDMLALVEREYAKNEQ